MTGISAQLDTTELPGLITTTEAARLIGRDPRTVSRWVRQGAVPGLGVEIAGRVYIRRPILEGLVNGDTGDVSPA